MRARAVADPILADSAADSRDQTGKWTPKWRSPAFLVKGSFHVCPSHARADRDECIEFVNLNVVERPHIYQDRGGTRLGIAIGIGRPAAAWD